MAEGQQLRSRIWGVVKDSVASAITNPAKEQAERALRGLERRLLRMQKRIMRRAITAVLMLGGFLMLVAAGMFALGDFFGVARTWSTLIGAGVLLLASLFLFFLDRTDHNA